jgi:hypothetical protein
MCFGPTGQEFTIESYQPLYDVMYCISKLIHADYTIIYSLISRILSHDIGRKAKLISEFQNWNVFTILQKFDGYPQYFFWFYMLHGQSKNINKLGRVECHNANQTLEYINLKFIPIA